MIVISQKHHQLDWERSDTTKRIKMRLNVRQNVKSEIYSN